MDTAFDDTVQSSNEASPATFLAFVMETPGTCCAQHAEMLFIFGLIVYLYLPRGKDKSGRSQCLADDLQVGGLCLFLVIQATIGFEAALTFSLTVTLFYVVRHRWKVQPIKEKIVPETRGQTRQSPSATRLEESARTTRQHCTLEAQARDIVRGLTPLRCDEAASNKIALQTKYCVNRVVPEAEVHAIPVGNAAVLAARGSRPEVDVVVTVAPDILAERLRVYYIARRSRKHRDSLGNLCMLHKAATRTLSELLTFACYWRSQLTSPECKVVMLLPTSMRICHDVIYFNFYVNAQYPLRMHSLLSEACLRRKKLLLVVTHWAGQRCITNVQRGQFAKYAWAALVWYFCKFRPQAYKEAHDMIDCFQRFVSFYADWFLQDDHPSVCFSRAVQVPPGKFLLHLPYIEDYLEPGTDLAEHVTVDGFTRVKDELQRAQEILSRTDGNVAEGLFEKWTCEAL